jgi:arabinofuranan 3-O-arabinosyltransferase
MSVCSLVLVTVAMIQQPGRIVADTKLDLVVDPGRFLERATSLWDPIGFFGQVQNQAYGYFFPMGPFFWGGHVLGMEPWVVQRLWWAVVLVVAFHGMVRLAVQLNIGTLTTQLIGGLVFALSPRIVSVLGGSSIEVWPMAMAPWVLVALIAGTTRRSPVAMAAASAVCVALVGGVNAAAAAAVVPLGAIWLLMAPPGPRRRRMLVAWPAFLLLGTLWWLVPLFVLGSYSPPFLDYIESASLTTFDTTLLDALRGTSNWTSYLSQTNIAGRALISEPVLLLNLAVVLALSVAGLARRDLPHRRFLWVSLLVGLVLVTMGHTASHGGLGADSVQAALDGTLAPLRNTHKFDVVLRVPLVLGFVHILTIAMRSPAAMAPRAARRWTAGTGVVALALVGIAGSTSPAWAGDLAPRDTFADVPGYWRQAANWLDEHASDDRALVVPASSFGSYQWGSTNDDVLQALATSPWGVRNAIPLTNPGNIRMLDAVEREVTDGRGSKALREYLLASGVSLLLVRNDLNPSTDGVDPELVHAAIESIPGVRRVASFGPTVGGAPTIEGTKGRFFVDQGWQSEHPAIEVYRVGATAPVRAQPVGSVPVVVGSAESQVGLLASGRSTSRSVRYAPDVRRDDVPSFYLMTDGERRQEVAFGRVHDNRSSSLARSDRYVADRPVHDYLERGAGRWTTTPVLKGARRISASSSRASVGTTARIDLSAQPWSAFDGDPMTSWRAAPEDAGSRSWIRIDLEDSVQVGGMTVTVDGDPVDSTKLVVRTDHESVTLDGRGDTPRSVRGFERPTRSVTISAPSSVASQLAISDIHIPNVRLSRPLRVPTPPAAWGSPSALMLEASAGYRSGCLVVDGYLRCASGADSWGEDGRTIDREVSLPSGDTYPWQLTVEPIGGEALDALTQRGRLVTVRASSQVTRGAQATAKSAADGDPETSWVAASDDERPRLVVSWIGERRISTITAQVEGLTAASRPTRGTLRFPDGSRRLVRFDADGIAHFRAVTTNRIEIEITDAQDARNLNSAGGATVLPVGISELRIGTTDILPLSTDDEVQRFPCGSGPTVTVDGNPVRTTVVASPAVLTSGMQLTAQPCSSDDRTINLSPGQHRITVRGTDSVRPVRLALGETVAATGATDVRASRWGVSSRKVAVGGAGAPQLVTVVENANAGWTPAEDQVESVMVNGWQQGWLVDSDELTLQYVPNSIYRWGLIVGAGLFLVLLIIWAVASAVGSGHLPVSAPRASHRRHALGVLVITMVAVLAVGGLLGTVAALIGAAAATAWSRRGDVALLAGGLVAIPAIAAATRPWGGARAWFGTADWPQLMIAVVLGVVAASVAGLPTRRSRAMGDSTTAWTVAAAATDPTSVNTSTSMK